MTYTWKGLVNVILILPLVINLSCAPISNIFLRVWPWAVSWLHSNANRKVISVAVGDDIIIIPKPWVCALQSELYLYDVPPHRLTCKNSSILHLSIFRL